MIGPPRCLWSRSTSNRAKFFQQVGTAPVRDAYFGMGHTDLIGQLDNVQGFIQKWNYKVCVVLKPWVIDLELLVA